MPKNVSGRATSIPIGLTIGAVISLIITLAGTATTAHLVGTEKIGEEGIGYAAMLILFISSAIGAWGAISNIKRMRLQVCMMSSGVYYLILIAITAMFFGGQYGGMLVTAIVTFAGGAVVAVLPGKTWNKMKFKKRAYR